MVITINYVFDGPCGDCPFQFSRACDTKTCIHWIAWDEVLATIKELSE